jgi:hypothetical protein
MAETSKPRETGVFPRRELLEALVHEYHRHRRPDVRTRFERVLEERVPKARVRKEWNEYLDDRGKRPAEPRALPQLLYRGVSDFGSVIEVRRSDEAELLVEIDDAVVDRLESADEIGAPEFRFDGTPYNETFGVSGTALDALADFVEGDAPPPWGDAPALLTDGLIDSRLRLTPRGRRAITARRR